MYTDSIGKIMGYIGSITRETFSYSGVTYKPKDVSVTLDLFRDYTCPSNCGGCCMRFSLDYLPSEAEKVSHPLSPRTIEVKGKEKTIFSDMQITGGKKCFYLNKENGRCNIHGDHPFSCDFELIRFTNFANRVRINVQNFGRGWAFTRIDGEKGALCEVLPVNEESRASSIRKIKRLKEWIDYFGVDTWIDEIIGWAESRPTKNLFIKVEEGQNYFKCP